MNRRRVSRSEVGVRLTLDTRAAEASMQGLDDAFRSLSEALERRARRRRWLRAAGVCTLLAAVLGLELWAIYRATAGWPL